MGVLGYTIAGATAVVLVAGAIHISENDPYAWNQALYFIEEQTGIDVHKSAEDIEHIIGSCFPNGEGETLCTIPK